MRDIRCDLQERIELTVEQRTELEKRLQALEEREQRLRALLRDEGGQSAISPYEQPLLSLGIPADTATGARLREFVLQALSDGHEWDLNDLKKQAQGIALTTAGASGRRALHNLRFCDSMLRAAAGCGRRGCGGSWVS
jgi:hypothetical protein